MSAERSLTPASISTDNVKSSPTDREHRLKLYSTAAIAAGVTVMALAQPAEGKVVITRKNLSLPPNNPVYISLNNDGTNDFSSPSTVWPTKAQLTRLFT